LRYSVILILPPPPLPIIIAVIIITLILYYCFIAVIVMLQLQEYIQTNEDVYRKILLYEVRIRRFIVHIVWCLLVYAVNDMHQFNVDSKVIEAYAV